MPVMFFIHGGAFYAGTQIKMGPERLGDVADIVLVAINYRVGPLGEISFANLQFNHYLLFRFYKETASFGKIGFTKQIEILFVKCKLIIPLVLIIHRNQ